MKTFIIIPAYNEEKNIGQVANEAKQYGQVVVVDDGSSDDTYKAVKKLGAVRLRHVVNRGQGASLKTGIDYALEQGAEIIVTIDSDGQHLTAEIPKLIEPILRGEAEIVLGSRFLSTDSQGLKTDDNGLRINAARTLNIPWTKKWLILKPAVLVEKMFTGLKLSDVHQGFRAMNRVAAEKIQITQDRMAHATEIVSEIKRHCLRHKEVPTSVIYKKYGQGLRGGAKILKDLIFRRVIY